MLKRNIVIIVSFYILAILQNSFFSHFTILGTAPNLIFSLFFCLVFFSLPTQVFANDKRINVYYQIIFYAIIAGLFSDIFFSTYLGPSIILFTAIGILIKKTQLLLRVGRDNYPFSHFIFLFLIYFILYQSLFMMYICFIDPLHIPVDFNFKIILSAFYSLFLSLLGFWSIKKYVKKI